MIGRVACKGIYERAMSRVGASWNLERDPPKTRRLVSYAIAAGQTTDQVVASLRQPGEVLDLGSQEICVYSDLKVTFVDGKASDVQ